MGIKSKYGPHIDFPEDITFHELLMANIEQNAMHKPNRPAMVRLCVLINVSILFSQIDVNDSSHYYTFNDVLVRSTQLSRVLFSLGVQYKGCVLCAIHTCLDAPVTLIGILLCGATLSPVNPLYNPGLGNKSFEEDFLHRGAGETDQRLSVQCGRVYG